MSIIGFVLYWALQIFVFAMLARFVSDLVMSFFAYTLTDPPLKFVRRFVPPLRLGGIALDLAWTVVFFAAIILQGFARSL